MAHLLSGVVHLLSGVAHLLSGVVHLLSGMAHLGGSVPGFAVPLWTLAVCLNVAVWTEVEGWSEVIGSSEPVVAALGDDVILPCHVDHRLDVEGLTVEWSRLDVRPDPGDLLSEYKYVHFYHDNHDVEDVKMLSYAGRTVLVKGELKHGNVSLKIMNVKLSDRGTYRCYIPQLGSASIVELVVEANSVKTWTADPLEMDVKGGRRHLSTLIPVLVVLSLLILGGGVSACFRKHKKSQKQNNDLNPVRPPLA